MTEEQKLNLVVSAETAQAQQKIKDIGNTQVKPIKVDVEANAIKGAFDASGFGKITNALHGIRELANKVLSAFGLIGFSIGIAMTLVNVVSMLKTKLEETAKAVAKLRFDSEMRAAAAETERLCTAHEKLTNLLKDELDTMAKQNAIGDLETTARRDREDGARAAERARQIYAAATPEEEQRLRDSFSLEDARIADRRQNEDRKERMRRLDEEESAYAPKARFLQDNQKSIDQQLAIEELNVRRARGSRKEGEAISEQEKAAAARVEALKKSKTQNELAILSLEKEAEYRRKQIAALEGMPEANTAAVILLQQQQAAKERARENAKATTEADAEWQRRKQREAEQQATDEAVLKAQAESARNAAKEMRREYAAEMGKDPGERDAEKLATLRGRIDASDADAERYASRAKEIAKQESEKQFASLEALADRAANVDGVSRNRLTAMGLGSGVRAGNEYASELRKVIDLLRENVNATKDNKPQGQNVGVAVFGE